jgi:imidazolonepropionase-like amidohydrolase
MTQGSLLITNATAIDCTGTPAREGCDILIVDGLISRIGPTGRENGRDGPGAQVIDATGLHAIPGLIDAHCHMTYGEARNEEEIDLYTSVETRAMQAAWNAAKVLRAGFTSISQPGGSYYVGVALRDAIRRGFVQGPRMATAGRYITTSNGLTDWYPDSVGVPEGSIGVLANTLPEMINEVRHQVKNGVDFIKLADSPMGNYQAFTNDEVRQLADLAHQLGKRITIHARGSAEVSAAVAAGFDWIMHGNEMTDETIARLAESQIPLVPTLTLLANARDAGAPFGVPAGLHDRWSRMLDDTGLTLHRARAAGVVFVTGTDSGFSLTPYGEWHARELVLLAEYAGLTPLEALQAATVNAAVTIGQEGRLGTLEPGKVADILLVNGDPLKDLSLLLDRQNIRTVIKDGEPVVFDEEALRRPWDSERIQAYSYRDFRYADRNDAVKPATKTTRPVLS